MFYTRFTILQTCKKKKQKKTCDKSKKQRNTAVATYFAN